MYRTDGQDRAAKLAERRHRSSERSAARVILMGSLLLKFHVILNFMYYVHITTIMSFRPA